MTLTVRERADIIGTLRFVSVYAMETLARWVPTTPDLEAKILFGRHIWEFAQHADSLGRRTHELRAALHYSPEPLPAFAKCLALLRATEGARERVESFYDVFIPDLAGRYQAFLSSTDPLLDEPSVRIVERILSDLSRLTAESHAARADRRDMTGSGSGTADRLRSQLAAATDCVRHREPAATALEGLA